MPGMDEDKGRKAPGLEPRDAPAPEEDLAGRLRSLDERLDRKQEERGAKAKASKPDNSGMGAALRLSTDFAAAVLVGAALGWGIDRFFGVTPWGMIVFLILGFVAGVLNVLRTAGRISDPHAKSARPGRPEMYDDEED